MTTKLYLVIENNEIHTNSNLFLIFLYWMNLDDEVGMMLEAQNLNIFPVTFVRNYYY